MFPPEEMVTSLPIGSSIFGTHFLIALLHPLLLPVLNVNSVSFTLMNSHCFYICFYIFIFHGTFGGLGTMYNVHLGLIGKRVVDFLLVLIELFARCYG